MNWAEPGRNAVICHGEGISVTCIGSTWYQAYLMKGKWERSHNDTFLQRTYCAYVDRLARALTDIIAGREVLAREVEAALRG